MAILGTARLNIEGGSVTVSRLWNDRYSLKFLCSTKSPKTDWYYQNIGGVLPEFGDNQDHFFGTGVDESWAPPDGSVYPNMICVESSHEYINSIGEYRTAVSYETLTSSWVQEKDDTIDYDLNGLKRVSRQSVALPDTAYAKVVGTTDMDSNGTTVYLAKYQIDETDAKWTLTETWLEAGTLSVSTRNLSEGVVEVTTVFLVVEGTTVGPIVRKNTDNLEGLKTISVTTLQDKDGNSIITGGENLVHQYEKKSDFTYPGVVKLRQDIITSDVGVDPILLNFELFPPVQNKITSKVSVIFQTASDIAASDETYDDGSGAADSYWNPTEWARTYVSGIGWQYSAFSKSQGLRGYRVDPDVSGISSLTPSGSNVFRSNGVVIFTAAGTSYVEPVSSSTEGNIFARVNGVSDQDGLLFTVDSQRIYGNTPFILQASGGPVDPSGTKYVLDIDIRPAFEDVDGNIYYKKTIVTATP